MRSIADSEVEGFADWALRCPEAAPCVLEQRLYVEGEGREPLLHVAFQQTDAGPGIAGLARLPLGVLLPSGVAIAITGREPERLGFHHCRQEGCVVVFELSQSLRRAFERAKTAEVTFTTAEGRTVGLPLSLMGISAGLRALEAR